MNFDKEFKSVFLGGRGVGGGGGREGGGWGEGGRGEGGGSGPPLLLQIFIKHFWHNHFLGSSLTKNELIISCYCLGLRKCSLKKINHFYIIYYIHQ